jgi:hypothetical protein
METLRELRGGRTLEDLADNVAEIVRAVRATGKTGELTIKLKFKPPKAGGASYLMVEDSFKATVPKLDHGDTVFFHTKDGGLTRQDPSQMDLLPVRAVDAERVDVKTGEIIPAGGSNNG